jgi:lysozyme
MGLALSDIPVKVRVSAAILLVSLSTVTGIKVYEGYSSGAIIPVRGDRPTIGHGHTLGVKMGDTVTPARAMQMLGDDINIHANAIRKCIKVPLSKNEWGGFLTLSFNIGSGAFCKKAKAGDPPNLIDLINAERYAEACERIDAFNRGPSPGKDRHGKKIPGKVLKGLVTRRAAERKICESDEVFL